MLFVLFAQHPAKWHPALCPGLLRAEIAQVHNACAPRSAGAVPEPCVLSAEAQHCTWDTGSASWLCLGRTGRVRREVSKQNPTKRSVRSAQLGLHGILGSTARPELPQKSSFQGESRTGGHKHPTSLSEAVPRAQPFCRRPGLRSAPTAGGPAPRPAQPRSARQRPPPRGPRRASASRAPLPPLPSARTMAAGRPAARRSRSRARARPRPAPPAAPPLPSPRPPPAAPAAPRPRRHPARRARAPALASREPAAVRGPPGAAACGRPLVGGGGTREGGGGSGGGRSFPDSWRLRRWLLLRGSPLEARDPRAPPY